jgi:8-oxo-dGTP pyrophosphatase MutT (NUDIX family)
MGRYPNYRVAVEVMLKVDGKLLLMKRAPDCDVAPGVWSVPAGKVKYEEIPLKAVVRECFEETGIDVKIVREIDCRAFKTQIRGEDAFRLVYAYLVEPIDVKNCEVKLSDEHTEFAWVDRNEIEDEKYECLQKEVKEAIIKNIF